MAVSKKRGPGRPSLSRKGGKSFTTSVRLSEAEKKILSGIVENEGAKNLADAVRFCVRSWALHPVANTWGRFKVL